MNFQGDMPSISIDHSKDHSVLVFDMTSMQHVTDNRQNPELVEEPLKLKQNVSFFLEYVTELIVLGEILSAVSVDNFTVVGKNL